MANQDDFVVVAIAEEPCVACHAHEDVRADGGGDGVPLCDECLFDAAVPLSYEDLGVGD
jgi:hypothetical protein